MQTHQQDIIIVGGGVIGCSILHQLALHASPQTKIALIESCPKVANCASGKSGGFLARHWCDGEGALQHLARTSFDMHTDFASRFENPSSKLGFRYMSAVSLEFLSKAEGEENQKQNINSIKTPSWLRGSQTGNVEQLAKQEKYETAQVHPRLLTETLLEESQKLLQERLTVMTSTSVKKILFNDNNKKVQGVQVLVDENKTTIIVNAKIVILALGPWMGHVERMINNNSSSNISCAPFLVELSRGFHPSKVQSIILCSTVAGENQQQIPAEAVFAGPSAQNAKSFPFEPEIYPRPDGTIYVCGISDSEPLPEDPSSVKGHDGKARVLLEFANGVMSTTTPNALVESNACYLPTPADRRRPLIGAIPETDSTLYVCAGHTCWGILNSFASGLAIREMIQHDNENDFGKEFLSGGHDKNLTSGNKSFTIRSAISEELEPKNRLKYEQQKSSNNSAPTKRSNEHW